MGSRKWSFVEEPRPPPTGSTWRFALGYIGALAIVACGLVLMLR